MIYFDNAATTVPLETLPHPTAPINFIGNPSSPHAVGIKAERELSRCRSELSNIIGCTEKELTFTSGGTESNNMAILGYVLANKRQHIKIFAQPWEHPSILEPINFATANFDVSATIVPMEQWRTTEKGLQLICLSQVNHETGDMPNIAEISARLKKENPQTIILVDGAQGFTKHPVNFHHMDIYTFSGHKFNAPTGVGGLASRVRLLPLTFGGGQENGLRPGTENLQGIIAMANAAKFHKENSFNPAEIRTELQKLTEFLPNIYINHLSSETSLYILNLSFTGIKGETLVHLLSEKGIYASMGAACRSRKKVKTTLEHMGFSQERVESAVRFSFAHTNTLEEARTAVQTITESVASLRRVLKGHN